MNSRLPLRDPNAPVGAIARASAESPDLKVSFEFFPPKSEKMEEKLWSSIEKLAPLSPDFVSVTYGAGGSTRERTHRTGLKKIADFEVSVSAYPEQHPESSDWSVEIDNLKRKIDAGATRAITQFFFSPDIFWRFQDRVLDAGIDIPIVPGLMLQPNFKGLARMSKMCGVAVPDWYAGLFEGLDDDPITRDMLTATLAAELTAELRDRGVDHFHLYTLNRAEIAMAVSRILGLHNRKKKLASL